MDFRRKSKRIRKDSGRITKDLSLPIYQVLRSFSVLTAEHSITGVEGIEPSSGVLETLILPMNYTPIWNSAKFALPE